MDTPYLTDRKICTYYATCLLRIVSSLCNYARNVPILNKSICAMNMLQRVQLPSSLSSGIGTCLSNAISKYCDEGSRSRNTQTALRYQVLAGCEGAR